MSSQNTVADIISVKDPEAFDLLQKILERPAMFVGTPRFDYADHLFSGYCWGRGTGVEFMPSKELQYWLLHTQSVSLYGEISGRSLFYRCFGTGKIAFEKYKEFLYAQMPEEWPVVNSGDPIVKSLTSCSQAVDVEIYAYESNHNLVRHDLINDGIPKDNIDFVRAAKKSIKQHGEVRYDWADGDLHSHNMKLAKTTVDTVREMIKNSNIEFDELKIYVRKEQLFNQVRFLYRCGQEWLDDGAIITDPNNHNLLVAMHANAKNASADALRECECDVFDMQDYDFMFVPDAFVYADDKTFHSEFLQWKNGIV